MKYKVEDELKKLKLMVLYVNKLVGKLGLKKQEFLGGLDFNTDSRHFKELLKVTVICADFDGVKGVRFDIRDSLYKRINGRVEYITLLEPFDDDRYGRDTGLYKEKTDIDKCSVIQELKKVVRSMIREPEYHFRVDF